ncbi:bifunctional phosphopantothenoylcysteine decarboxylase/phosphopantothenate--cysteine ligase CoaBC [Lachnospira pectinoschiza]|uniref:Coenzyme A biosynthesis bifunctional protein CoaBC n=1 Tax=Lachnospira pectinoschiza TaxID=28052 RepID=A0A1G9VSW5_9FIRM|nr:bifunctional phosphopantothenoylcysteine decarboxylase/phosphopantothenate--cysteine ligase CoaBC [Lachnospira pectinoschiza]SDM75298.1 phosphopantothenoylcysteine decarboxylase / phosphopantothenate--cysteine ligase [Lachnospira pectinoschiza]
MLTNKNVVIGVTGSIAAYKIANLASMLVKQHANVDVIMTENATNFINPIAFETLTSNKCIVDTFDRNFQFNVEHVSLAKKADIFLVAPASANVIGKMAAGIADDMLTTTLLAAKCPIYVAPAMNTNMYTNRIVQDNIAKLKSYGMHFITPASGRLACNDIGIGKLASEEVLMDNILREIAMPHDLEGLKVVVTAGPTREKIDPVRYISNNSTGKMGYAIAKVAMMRGANVTLISGPTSLAKPRFVDAIDVVSARDMYEAVVEEAKDADIVIKAAAVADYRPDTVADEKIKKKDGDMSISLERTDDILASLGANKSDKLFLCGFSMETENLIENSRKKLDKKNLDMIVCNNLKVAGAGFGTDTNVVTLITKSDIKELPIMSKEEVASKLLDEIMALRK